MFTTEAIVDVIRIVVGVVGIGMAGSLFSAASNTTNRVTAALLALISIPLVVTGGTGFLTTGTEPTSWVPLVSTVVTSTMTLFGLVAFLYAIRSAFGFASPGNGKSASAAKQQQIATAVVAFAIGAAILGTHMAAFRAMIGL